MRGEEAPINIELNAPNTIAVFGTMRFDPIESLTGRPLEDWFGKALVDSTIEGSDGSRRSYTLQFHEGEGFEIPGLFAIRNDAGKLILAVPLGHAGTVSRRLKGVEGRIRDGSLAEYTLPTDGSRLVGFDTPFGVVQIRALRERLRARNA